jgi:hypothetical protein
MQHTIIVILLIVAAISFGLAAFGVPARVNWIGLGLLAWVVSVLIPVLQQ